jgi:hypothetical protein
MRRRLCLHASLGQESATFAKSSMSVSPCRKPGRWLVGGGQGRAAAKPRPPRRPGPARREPHSPRFGSDSGDIPRRIHDDEDDGSLDQAPRQGGIACGGAASRGRVPSCSGGAGRARAAAPNGPNRPDREGGWGATRTVVGEPGWRRPNPPFTCAHIAIAWDRGGIRHGGPGLIAAFGTSQVVGNMPFVAARAGPPGPCPAAGAGRRANPPFTCARIAATAGRLG